MAVNVEAFYDMINGIAKRQVQATPMDLTIDAKIAKLYNVDIGEYKVEYQGNIFSAFSADPTVAYNVGERVYVLVPQGDFSTKKVILGYSKYESNVSDSDRIDLQNQYIVQGPNWYEVDGENYLPDHHPLKICACPLVAKDKLVTDDGKGGGAYYEDVGYQRNPVNHNDEYLLQTWAENLQKLNDEARRTYEEDFVKNTGKMMEVLDGLDAQRYLDDEGYREEFLTNLKQYTEEATTRPVGRQPTLATTNDIDERFQHYADSFDYIMISAKFRTEFTYPHQKGQYWLNVQFWTENKDYLPPDDPEADNFRGIPNFKISEFQLGFQQFNGAPYQFAVDTPQKAFYKINPGELRGLYRVSLMQDGNFIADMIPSYDPDTGEMRYRIEDRVYDKNNIFCDDIEIRFAMKVDMLDTPYYCYIETPQGDKVYKQSETVKYGRTHVDLVPHFLHQSQEITSECEILWFREDLTVTPNTPTDKDKYGKVWTDYTGPGWRPIEQFQDPDLHDYEVAKDGTLTVYDTAIPWKWRFKVVCIYKSTAETAMVFGTAMQEIANRDSKYSIYLEEFTTPNSTITNLRINEKQPRRVGIDLLPGQKDGGFKYPEWFGSWYVQLPDNSYTLATDESSFMRGPLTINNWLIYDSVTFRVACYDPLEVAGEFGINSEEAWTQSQVIGYLEKTYISADGDAMIDWIGRKAFNYTARGTAYPSISKNEYTLQPKINWTGDPTAYHVSIIAPDGAKLGSRNFYNQNVDKDNVNNICGNGYDPEGSMMTNMYVDADNVVHFKVRPEFDINRDKNVLVARVLSIADGQWYEAICEVQFSKDGQSGTQGSEWTAQIDLTNSKIQYKKVFHPVRGEYYDVAQPAYSARLGSLAYPLIVYRTEDKATGREKLVQDNSVEHGTRVFIRPFVTREGQDLMEYQGDSKYYKVVASWDVRYSKTATFGPCRNASFLRLKDAVTGNWVTMSNEDNGGYQFGEKDVNPKDAPGMFGQTVWNGQDRTRAANAQYCAVEVVFDDAQFRLMAGELTGLTKEEQAAIDSGAIINMMAAMGYYFVVKCTIDVWSNDEQDFPKISGTNKYDQILNQQILEKNKIGEDNLDTATVRYTPTMRRVKTIVSYYPVDIFIHDKESMPSIQNNYFPIYTTKCNWPREIEYSARGDAPVVDSNYLEFLYGFRPDTLQPGETGVTSSLQKPLLIEPVSLVSRMARIEKVQNPIDDVEVTTADGEDLVVSGEILNQNQATIAGVSDSQFKYKPSTKLNWEEGFVGTLMGRFDWESLHGAYYRNQIFQVNNYENMDINSWDGISIDINEDNGTIFAPTLGAGFKNPFTNAFTGVIMGVNSGFRRQQRNADGSVAQGQGINQLAVVGMTQDEMLQYDYMTGLFGYQDGYSSFGLLENGTAFFGRADRGGRIIIDGYNATIYGGANGVFTSPKIGDAMWNAMRLTMVDLSHATSGDVTDYINKDGSVKELKDNENTIDEDMEYPTGKKIDDLTGAEVTVGDPQGEIPEEKDPTTTAVQGITQGFGGGYFGQLKSDANDPYGVIKGLPDWYKLTWIGAYLVPNGERPYWLQTDRDKFEQASEDDTKYTRTETWVERKMVNGRYAWEPIEDGLGTKYKDGAVFIPNPKFVPQLGDIKVDKKAQMKQEVEAGIYKPYNEGSQVKFSDDLNEQDLDWGGHNFGVNYWNPSIDDIRTYLNWTDGDNKNGPITGFGPSRASTTPAIEIGQHPHGLMPGLIPFSYPLEDIFKQLYIPGDRNFMVTYDGTLWAMNGIFMGNIIGSNIIGGRINGAEIGIGDLLDQNELGNMLWPTSIGDWGELAPAVMVPARDTDAYIDFGFVDKTYQVSPDGTVFMKEAVIYGGDIHIGTFHILGRSQEAHNPIRHKEEEGWLLQFGVSDFMGPVHVYGSIGIGPKVTSDRPDKFSGAGTYKGTGNLLQTSGIAALGIILPWKNGKPIIQFHQLISQAANHNSDSNIYYMDLKSDDLDYTPKKLLTAGQPYIANWTNGQSIEQIAMFSVMTGNPNPVEDEDANDLPPEKPRISYKMLNSVEATLANYLKQAKNTVDQQKLAQIYRNIYKQLEILDDAGVWILGYHDEWEMGYQYVQNATLRKNIRDAITLTKQTHINSDVVMAGTPATKPGDGYKGHFWPMSFRYIPTDKDSDESMSPTIRAVHGYLTTMDIFRSKSFEIQINGSGIKAPSVEGSNYFRVGPWGQEGCRYYICNGWQREEVSEEPRWDRQADVFENGQWIKDGHGNPDYASSPRGVFGLVDRDLPKSAIGDAPDAAKKVPPAIGMTSWGKSPIIFSSNDNFAINVAVDIYNNINSMDQTFVENRGAQKYDGTPPTTRYTEYFGKELTRMTSVVNPYNDPRYQEWLSTKEDELSLSTTKEGGPLIEGRGMIGFAQLMYPGSVGYRYRPWWKENVAGFALDAGAQLAMQLEQTYNAGHGGVYMWGKEDVGVHIMAHEEDTLGVSKDGTVSELFLFHEQASLIGEKLLVMGTYPQNYAQLKDGGMPGLIKNKFGPGNGLSHMPNTTRGSGLAFIEGMIRSAATSGFTFVAGPGLDLVTSRNSGWHGTECNPQMGIGGAAGDHMEMFHQAYINIHKGTVGDNTAEGGKRTPSLGIGMDGKGAYGDACYISDSKGAMKGLDGKVMMVDSWAIPDNQFCIYARFG